MKNPVLEESLELYVHGREFFRLHMGYLVVVALFLVAVWPTRSYMYFFRTEAVPLVFLANSVFLIVVSALISFYVGLDRIGTTRMIRYSEWLERTTVPVRSLLLGKLITAGLHSVFLTAITIPVLVTAAGPSGVPLDVVPGVALVIFLSALNCRVAAMVVGHYGEQSYVVRTVGVWVFAAFLFILTLQIFRPLNPVVAAVEQIAVGAPGAVAGMEPGAERVRALSLISLSVLAVGLSGGFWTALVRHRAAAKRRGL